MSSRRRREVPIEDSWRMIEGEHDSFDTTILPPSTFNSSDIPLTQHSSSIGLPSQPFSSFGGAAAPGLNSQDSIRDFATHQEDDQVILREPFRPSLPPTPSAASARSLEPQFRMPRVDVMDDDRQSGRSSRTARQSDEGARRRLKTSQAMATGRKSGGRRRRDSYDDHVSESDDDDNSHIRRRKDRTIRGHVADNLPTAIYNILTWLLSVLGLALNYAKKPLGFLLAIYLVLGSLIMASNLVTKSISTSLSPLCRIPFAASLLHLPFCPETSLFGWPLGGDGVNGTSFEFDDLMGVQGKFEQVLEKSAEGVSLPMEMKKSETSIRDLRTLVKHSEIAARDELVFEFDGYIDTARTAASDLQKFNTHVGSAVDAVISINRWTSRYIESLGPPPSSSSSSSTTISSTQDPTSVLTNLANWLFYPFTPANAPLDERLILDKYIESTSLVSSRITTLLLEAQSVLRLLTRAEDHLNLIYDIVLRSQANVASRRDQIFWNIWTLIGANHAHLSKLSNQLQLLKRVDTQRVTAIAQLNALVMELETIQAGLDDLRDRVAEPGLLRGSAGPGGKIPLSVHIDTIDRGVERLEDARRRMSAAENDRVRDTLVKGGVKDERLLEGQ